MISWRCPTCEGHWECANVWTVGESRHEVRLCENGHRWSRTQTFDRVTGPTDVKTVVLSGPEGIVGTFESRAMHA